MEIQITAPVEAQPLDDEGDPIGETVTLPPGRYRLRSGMTQQDDGSQTAWVVPVEDEDKLYEARLALPVE